jgi:hypothetical protein
MIIPLHLQTFFTAYVECALWSSTDNNGNPLDKNHTIDNIAPDTQEKMLKDCQEFFDSNLTDISETMLKQAGHDFWLTRNRHGAGFWDGDWPEPFDKSLTDSAHNFGEFNLYIGDDGLIYA